MKLCKLNINSRKKYYITGTLVIINKYKILRIQNPLFLQDVKIGFCLGEPHGCGSRMSENFILVDYNNEKNLTLF